MKKIAFLDSGIGGLTVLEAFTKANKLNSFEEILYLADLKNLPYGGRSLEELHEILLSNLVWLELQNVDVVILACNTSSSLLNDEIKAKFKGMQIYGLLDGLELLPMTIPAFNSLKIAVFSTLATHNTGAYLEKLETIYSSGASFYSIPCPKLVPFIENTFFQEEALAIDLLTEYTEVLPRNLDALLFGCTHYPLLRLPLQRILPEVQLVDPAELLASKLNFNTEKFIETKLSVYTTGSDILELQTKVSNLEEYLSCVRRKDISFGVAETMAREITA